MKGRSRRLVVATLVAGLLLAGSTGAAFTGVPADGSQINNDPGNGIDPGQDAGASDVVGGSVTAGGVNVPWAAFEQRVGGAQHIFVRAFRNGVWSTQGQSLNIGPLVQAEAPSIDFAGSARDVPWVSWHEPNAAFGVSQVFASRFCSTANGVCGAGNIWVPEGQQRAPAVPSLNINTDRAAEDPAVAGGATVAGGESVPWVAWKERDGSIGGGGNKDQIFVARGVRQSTGSAPCSGFEPSTSASAGFFCWQQVGLERLAKTGGSSPAGDPTLSIDPSRDSTAPDAAFAGSGDTVPWVVWYETGASGLGLSGTDRVFAAKAVTDGTADGGFHWQALGNGTAGQTNVLDTSGPNGFGACAASTAAENACTLNKVATHHAEDPRIAAGTLSPGEATAPWVTWSEDIGGGAHAIFVSRLVGGDHFELFNGGQPISNVTRDATVPDITFSGNVPYVSWLENVGGSQRGFYGHFEGGASSPVFKPDTPATGVGLAPAGAPASLLETRSSMASGCTANPFTGDGAACPGGAVGTPFFLFTTDGTPQKLFGQAYQFTDVTTGSASAVTGRTANLSGSVNPGGAAVRVRFDYGKTTAYGSATPGQLLGATTAPTTFSASLSGLGTQTVMHYRAVAESDFGTLVGADQTFRTRDITAPTISLKLLTKRLRQVVRTRRLDLKLRVSEAARVTFTGKRSRRRTIAKGAVRLRKAATTRVSLKVGRKARRWFRHRRKARITVTAVGRDATGNKRTKTVRKTLRR